MHAVATSNGRRVPLPIERELLLAVQRTLLGSCLDVDALAPVSPAELRARVNDPDARTWLVRCAILVPYVSLEVDTAKVTVLDALAMQLGVAPELLRELHLRRLAQATRVARDQARRGARLYPTVHASSALHALVASLRAHRGDAALAARWRSLGAMPAGSLGRALLEFHRAHHLPLPGEPGAPDESLVERDLLRLLGGFAFDDAGEQGLSGFLAGLARLPMGRSLVLEAVAGCCTTSHLSGALARGVPPQPDLALLGAAYDRGVAASAALGREWSWWSVLGEDVGALRLRYGVRVARATRPAVAAERPVSAPRAA
jgi:hypothetical protein